MRTVALVGYSTAGKSTILRKIRDESGLDVEVFDSDRVISEKYDGHIYFIYSALVNGDDRTKAIEYIENGEDAFLKSLQYSERSRLIAFGPIVPCRKEWGPFFKRVHPIVFYLELTPEEVLKGLKDRRENHEKEGLQSLPAFGSWDEGLTTKYNRNSKRWVLIENKQTQLKNIYKNMKIPTEKYREIVSPGATFLARKLKNNKAYQDEFYDKLKAALLKESDV